MRREAGGKDTASGVFMRYFPALSDAPPANDENDFADCETKERKVWEGSGSTCSNCLASRCE